MPRIIRHYDAVELAACEACGAVFAMWVQAEEHEEKHHEARRLVRGMVADFRRKL